MTKEMLAAQIRSLEVQLAVVRAGLKRLNVSEPTHTMADLEGLLAGKALSTEEDLEAAKYAAEWNEGPPAGQGPALQSGGKPPQSI